MGNLELKGKLLELKQKKINMAVEASGLIRGLRSLLATALIEPLEQIKTDEIESLSGKLAELNREYKEVLDMMREIERELA